MKKIILCVVLLQILGSFFYAQTVVPDEMYRKVDSAIMEQSITDLNALLSGSSNEPWYPRLESYILKRVRQLVVRNELEQAKNLALAVVDNNLDNTEAVDLYQSIQNVQAKQVADTKKKEEQELLESYKQKASEEKIKQDASKIYKAVTNPETGKKVYLDQDFNTHYRSLNWDIRLGLLNVNFLNEKTGKSVRYGVSGGLYCFYHGEDYSIGTDIEGNVMLLTLSGEPAVDWSGSGVILGSSDAFGKYLVLRTGFSVIGYTYGSNVIDPTLFKTPVVGLGMHDVRIGDSGIYQMAIDYYPGSLYTDGMKLAFGGNMLLSFVVAHMQDFNIHFQTGIRDTLLMYDSGMTNEIKLVLGIGVGDYE